MLVQQSAPHSMENTVPGNWSKLVQLELFALFHILSSIKLFYITLQCTPSCIGQHTQQQHSALSSLGTSTGGNLGCLGA